MFKWILIDQANVQIYPIFTRKETYSINRKTFKAKELESIFYGSDYDKYELGQISERKLISNFLKRTDLDLTADEYIRLFKSDINPIEGMDKILSELYAKYKLAALINEGAEWAKYKFEGSGFGKYFQHSIVSWELGLKKPDRGFYEKALQIISAKAEECLFIDDKEKNCKGAEAIGIKSIIFKDAKQLRKEFIGLGIVLHNF